MNEYMGHVRPDDNDNDREPVSREMDWRVDGADMQVGLADIHKQRQEPAKVQNDV